MIIDANKLTELIKTKRDYTLRTLDQTTYRIGNNAGIFVERPKPAPDYRVPVPFIRRSIELKKGYLVKPGNILYKNLDDEIQDIYNQNDEQLKTAKMFEGCLTYGRSFELHWFQEGNGPRFAPLPIDQSIPIYSDDLEPDLIGFIWHRMDQEGNELATYYDNTHYTHFLKAKGQSEWQLVPEKTGPHIYGQVPVLEATTNCDKLNSFDHVLPLVDLYDRVLSQDVANELHRFANAYLLLADKINDVTTDDAGRTMIDRLKEIKIFDGLGDRSVRDSIAYLERNVNNTFIEATLDRVERLIYEMLNTPNPNDDSFATASGIAQAWKMLGANLDAANMEGYFSLFLFDRIRLLSALFSNLQSAVENADDVTIEFKRTEPHNLLELAQIAAMLKGTLSDETIIGIFPADIVPDVQEEIARLKESMGGLFDDAPTDGDGSAEDMEDDTAQEPTE